MTSVVAPNLQLTRYNQYQRPYSGLSALTLFCDFDGPIVNVSERYYSTYQVCLAQTAAFYQSQGITIPIQSLTKVIFWQMKQTRVPDVEIAMRSGLQGEQIDFFLKCVLETVNQPVLLEKDRLQPGVSWALALLHSQCVRLVLVTLRCQSQARQILRNYGLTRLFSGIYGTTEGHAAYKNYAHQKTELLRLAIKEQSGLSGASSSAWMVGDTEADIIAGKALSIPTIALTCGIRSYLHLKQFQPTSTQTDLLTATHYLLAKMKEGRNEQK
ncbi:MAG: HAD hydrolase-like protein [Coleofasciculaceae cyanobacterium]